MTQRWLSSVSFPAAVIDITYLGGGRWSSKAAICEWWDWGGNLSAVGKFYFYLLCFFSMGMVGGRRLEPVRRRPLLGLLGHVVACI